MIVLVLRLGLMVFGCRCRKCLINDCYLSFAVLNCGCLENDGSWCKVVVCIVLLLRAHSCQLLDDLVGSWLVVGHQAAGNTLQEHTAGLAKVCRSSCMCVRLQ